MKGFMLDENGDLVIEKNAIQTVEDKELIRQTMQTVLGTNLREWFFNRNEGIDFKVLITKKPDYDAIRAEIEDGIKQVDSGFSLTEYTYNFDKDKRALTIDFKAKKQNEVIEGSYTY